MRSDREERGERGEKINKNLGPVCVCVCVCVYQCVYICVHVCVPTPPHTYPSSSSERPVPLEGNPAPGSRCIVSVNNSPAGIIHRLQCNV